MTRLWLQTIVCLLLAILPSQLPVFRDSAPEFPESALQPPHSITVQMWALTDLGVNRGIPCSSARDQWGCTAYCTTGQYQQHCTNPGVHPPPVPKPSGQSGWVYPFSTNQVTVDIDGSAAYNGTTYNRYLRDVVAQETNPEAFHAKAVHAQAIAARTYAYYHATAANETVIDNSASYQVYVPFRYDSRKRNYGDYRPPIEAAMQDRIYLVPYPSPPPYVFAQYFEDRPGSTLSGGTPNLLAVADPISQTGCSSSVSGHGHGMSQQGASRWARGDGYYNVNTVPTCPWSVAWENPFKILAHYYTKVMFVDPSTSQTLPFIYRWNALEIRNLPPAVVQPGAVYTLDVHVQNTGWSLWSVPDNLMRLSYQLCQGATCTNTTGTYRVTMPREMPAGDDAWFNSLTIPIPSNWRGPAVIRLDVLTNDSLWFSGDFGWYTQDIRVCINSCKKVNLPTIRHGGPIPWMSDVGADTLVPPDSST